MCSVNCSNSTVGPRGGHGSGGPESTPAGLCIFLSDPDPELESKFCAKPDPDPESIEIFGSNRSLRGLHTCHVLSKIETVTSAFAKKFYGFTSKWWLFSNVDAWNVTFVFSK